MEKRARIWSGAVLLAALLSAGPALTQNAFEAINVKAFGARGDGAADDTAAIQSAIDAAQSRARSEPYPGTAYYITSPEVVFPSGKYLISDTLRLAGIVIRGEGYAVIEQKDAAKDIFRSDYAWRMTIEGLTFVGGRSHLSLANPNLDTGLLTVRDCRFYGSSGPAVECRKGTNSTLLTISNCVFLGCRQALVTHSDQTALRDCWITSAIEMKNQAVIENRGGRLTIDNLLGVPLVNGHDQRWIDNYGGNLSCMHCRFGGEGGGFTPVVNFTRFAPQASGTTILLDDCLVCAQGNNARKCAVYCEEIANAIQVRGCTLAGVPAIIADKRIDLKTYFRGARPGMLKFALTNCIGEFAGPLPKGLAQPILPPAAPSSAMMTLSPAATRAALQRAREMELPRLRLPLAASSFGGHQQQTDPAKFRAITPKSARWDLDDFTDATSEKNSEYLALAPLGEGAIIMRRRSARGNWPHVLIRDVTVDLDRCPYLTWRQRPAATDTPAAHAVKVMDKESGRLLLLHEDLGQDADYRYYAFNLRDLFGLTGGKRTFDIKFYYLGLRPGKSADPADFTYAKPGDYMVLHFLRLEAE
jgi:hypothetical protein